MATDPKTFYGNAYNEARAESLTKACRYLDMACANSDNETKERMALTAALKYEAEGLAIG